MALPTLEEIVAKFPPYDEQLIFNLEKKKDGSSVHLINTILAEYKFLHERKTGKNWQGLDYSKSTMLSFSILCNELDKAIRIFLATNNRHPIRNALGYC